MAAAAQKQPSKRRPRQLGGSGQWRRDFKLPGELWAWLLLSLLLSMAVLLAFFNGRAMYRVDQTEADPAGRAAYALNMLGLSALPPGLTAAHVFLMSVKPFMFGEQVELSDKAPDADGVVRGFVSRGFIYLHFSDENAVQNQQMRDLVRTRNGVRFDGWTHVVRLEGRELIRQGHLEVGSTKVDYVTQRGVVVHPEGDVRGLATVFAIRCPDLRTRTALWFGPDPDPVAAVEAIPLAGTVADEDAMAAFLSPFRFCP